MWFSLRETTTTASALKLLGICRFQNERRHVTDVPGTTTSTAYGPGTRQPLNTSALSAF